MLIPWNERWVADFPQLLGVIWVIGISLSDWNWSFNESMLGFF